MWKIIIGLVVIALLGAGGSLYYQSREKKNADEKTAMEETATPTPEEEPTPTAVEVDRAEYTVDILNGSGVVGRAGEVQTMLEDEDFSVGEVGNADNYDYEATEIQAGEDVTPAFLEELRDVLKEKYDVSTTFDNVDGDKSDKIVVIVGKTTTDEKEDEATTDESAEQTEEETPTPAEE